MTTTFTVKERSTQKFSATIKDEAGVAIPAASLTTLTLTLYEQVSKAIINSRDHQSILNLNGVTVDSAGLMTWTMSPADNAIVRDSALSEVHVALFEWTYNSGKAGKDEVWFTVPNMWGAA